jgi:hypothetical protein
MNIAQKEAPSPLADLTDMQALWFLQEEADAYRRQGNFGMALKRYIQIDKVRRSSEFLSC